MSRIGGAFPFPITDPIFGGGRVTLPSGGIFYPPSGNYVWSSGAVTQLQTFDPVQGAWITYADPLAGTCAFDCDGFNWRLINLSGTVQGALITNAGSGATNGIGSAATGVSVTFAAPASPGQTATAYPIVGGAVVAPTVSQAGSGFLVPPDVVIDPPPYGGIQATAICTLTAPGGGIASVTMVNAGAGYSAVPNFYLLPQAGSYQGAPQGGIAAGAFPPPGLVSPQNTVPSVAPIFLTGTGNALLNAATLTGSGTVTAVGMILNGSLYTGTTIPAVTISGAGAAAATAVMSLTMTGVTGLSGGAGYTGSGPIFISSLGTVVTAGQLNNNDLSQFPARGVTTISGGAVNSVVVEDSGFGFQKVPVLAFITTSGVATAQAGATAVVGGVNDTTLLQAKVN